MTNEQIEELKRLAEAATPGPWRFEPRAAYPADYNVFAGDVSIIEDTTYYPGAPLQNDAKFIAAANPAAIKELLSELSTLRAKTACTMGVGTGDGNLFVHGDYESIKAAQVLVIRAAASAPKAELTDERAAFQTWALSEGFICDYTEGASGFHYLVEETTLAWEGWQARAVLAQAAPVAAVPAGTSGWTAEQLVDAVADTWSLDKRYKLVEIDEKLRAMLAAAPAAPVAAAVPAGWVKNTGVRPVADDVLVEVECRYGPAEDVERADFWDWSSDGGPGDILFWRAAPAPGEASK